MTNISTNFPSNNIQQQSIQYIQVKFNINEIKRKEKEKIYFSHKQEC